MSPRSGLLLVVALAAFLSLIGSVPASAQGQEGAVWDLGTHPTGARHPTTVSATNISCKGKRDFEIEIEGQARRFLSITGPSRLDKIALGQTKTTPALMDLAGVPAGVYNDGAIVVRCLNCAAKCRQDLSRISVRLTVTDVVVPSGTSATATGSSDSTRERDPCPKDTSPCDELKARADAAREAAEAADRAAREAERNQQYDEQDADWEDEDLVRDLEYAKTLRRQAKDWRDLANDSRADAAVNRDRANQWPPGHEYRESWEYEVELDEGWARDRDARADRLEEEARKLEEPAERRRRAAEEQRTRAARLRAQATAMAQAAGDAQAAYEACLQRLKDECERQIRQAELAEQARIAYEERRRREEEQAAADAAAAAEAAANDPGRAFLPGHESLVPRQSPFCKWATFQIPREALVTDVRLMAANANDDTSALEVRTTSAVGSAIGFQYHCKKTSGSAVIAFTQSSGNNAKRYKLRVGCIPE